MIRLDNTQYFHFLHRANALRRSGSLCDALISVKNQTFKAHRLVLACASRRLAKKLAQAETDQEVHCTLEDLSARTFQQVLDFAYTQSLEVSEDDLRHLLEAAQFLEMQTLEEQCRRHLDALLHRTGEVGERHERNSESDEEAEVKKKRHEEEKLQETPVVKNITASITAEEARKKSRLSTSSRESVITSSASKLSSSPWTIPNHMWNSVSTLRRIAENYSTLMGAHPQPVPAAHATAFPTARIVPLLGAHFQSPAQHSVVASLHPHYAQHLYVGNTGTAANIETGRLQRMRKKARQKADKTSEISCPDVHKGDTVNDGKHCSSCPRRDPASSPPGEACARCRLFVTDCESKSNGQDLRGERPYQCQHCPKKFSLKHQLDTHHRIHTGEKPFECRLCGQRSRDFSAIIKHLRTHGGASPYRCTLCLEFCSSLVAMQSHVKRHPVHDFPPDWSIRRTYLYTSHITQH
ncbi:zinc finger and BTB domain-containing protein 16 [Phycodurus eques]|uniref:zinc finger and BTB domain-containing protein 16 n=1 Tax=Phycodurus eques TaxID=693459 RepID=UPI002ACE2169|nr:zinc finger and BTB domain-containing protein 16 [Phycodurus eques]